MFKSKTHTHIHAHIYTHTYTKHRKIQSKHEFGRAINSKENLLRIDKIEGLFVLILDPVRGGGIGNDLKGLLKSVDFHK